MKTPWFPIVVLVVVIGASVAAQSGDDLPRRQYDSGLSFLKGQRYAEALKDFQAIIESHPKSMVADNALLQVALYQIDVAHDFSTAQSAVDQLLKAYPDTDSAPMAYVVGGRIAMAKGRTPSDVDSAVASFERVERLFPGSDAVPAAGYYAGEALRLVRRHEEALVRYKMEPPYQMPDERHILSVVWSGGRTVHFANMRDHCWPHFMAGNDPAQEPGVRRQIRNDDGSPDWADLYARLQKGPVRDWTPSA